ncbi:phosphatase PAP2 family protein [Devosia sp.]|uniref:phosphatase PAP2 family protein n=1 Tax=Devosia sp. TaxID=1871048 RepID=UPI003A915926
MTDAVEIAKPSRLPRLPLLVLGYAGLAALLRPEVYLSMVADYASQALTAAPSLLILGISIAALVRRRSAPLAYVGELLRSRTLPFLVTALLAVLGIAAFTTFKLSITGFIPFWADPALANIDHAIHFGDLGLWLHQVIPDWYGYFIGVLYGPIWVLMWFGIMGGVALHPDPALRQRYFTTMALTIALLGTVLATLLASVGPIFYDQFYDSPRYAELLAQLNASAVGEHMALMRSMLLSNYGVEHPAMGTGISAMPSMHVAIATVNVLLLFRLNRVAGLFGCVYLLMILTGSVYLAWHYALDGYVSIAAVTTIWWLVGRFAQKARVSPLG